MSWRSILLLALVAAGCGRGGRSYVLVTSKGHTAIGATSLHLTVVNDGQSVGVDVVPTADPFDFSLSFDPDRAGAVDLMVDGKKSNNTLATRDAHTAIIPGGVAEVTVEFTAAQPDLGADALGGSDLTTTPDLTPPPDLTALPDLVKVFDLSDLLMPADVAVPPADFSTPADLKVPADLTIPPDLTPIGDMTQTADMTIGRCRALKGANVAMSGAASIMNIPFNLNIFAVEAWVYPAGNANMPVGLVTFGNVMNGVGWELGFNPGGSQPVFHVFDLMNRHVQVSGQNVTLNQWHHLAGVSDGANIRLYVDGVSVGNPQALMGGGVKYGPAGPLLFGDRMNGHIDEVRISNNARYQNNFQPPPPNLTLDGTTVYLYHIDEAGGNTTADVGGNNLTANIIGGASVGMAPCN